LLNAEPHPALNAREKVVIRKGSLEGNKGIAVRRKNSTRMVLTLDVIMKSISVEEDSGDLEAVGPVTPPLGYFSSPVSRQESPERRIASFLPGNPR
jgi:hypothetical protein